MAHLGQSPDIDEHSLPQDAHPVTERFDLGKDVRGQEYGLAALFGLEHAVPEGLLHERVESARRLVEHQQVGPGHEAGDEDQLLPVALGVGPYLFGGSSSKRVINSSR